MDDYKIIQLAHFFQVDIAIKKGIYSISPFEIEYFDKLSILKYTNELNELLSYIFSELKCVSLDIFGENQIIFSKIKHLENTIKKQFYLCGLNIDKLKCFYREYITNMDMDFINSVKSECVGYAFNGTSSINMAFSINEILHFIHSYIVNNERILQSIPLIDKKQNEFDYPISFRGIQSPIFEQLFHQFPISLDVGWTDMVAIDEKKMIMMVRDRGHALSIEITINNEKARIEYFIPKLCNIEMINKLPGISNKVTDDSIGATGVIETSINNLQEVLFDFISKVPTDKDIVFKSHKTN